VPREADVRIGDLVVTSGLGDRFPGGYPVAEVTAIDREPGQTFARVEAAPLAALDRGREVLLIRSNVREAAAAEQPAASGASAADTPVAPMPEAQDGPAAPATDAADSGPADETPEPPQ